MAAICVLLAYSFNTQAQCILTVGDRTKESIKQLELHGYSVSERKDLYKLTPQEIAKLADNNHFILYRGNGKNEFLLSITNGQGSSNWKPFAFAAPPVGPTQPIASTYSCTAMMSRVRLFVRTRQAIEDGFKILRHKPLDHDRTVGEIILDLEHSFYVHMNARQFLRAPVKPAYFEILRSVKSIREQMGEDFFKDWKQVRKLIYDKHQNNVDYCRDKASMTEALLDRCTNCVGETYLVTALFLDAGFQPPEGWQFGTQGFTDHFRPVLYNLKRKMTFDLVTGALGRFKGAIFDYETLIAGVLSGDDLLRTDYERISLSGLSPKYAWIDWGCYIPGWDVRPELRPSRFGMMNVCGKYAGWGAEIPEKADNQIKAGDKTIDEDSEQPGFLLKSQSETHHDDQSGADDPKREGKQRSKGDHGENGSGVGDGDGSLGYGLPAIGKWFADKFSKIGRSETELQRRRVEFSALADNLPPNERKAILDSIENGSFTEEAHRLFSVTLIGKQLGFPQRELMPIYTDMLSAEDIILPPLVQLVQDSVFDGLPYDDPFIIQNLPIELMIKDGPNEKAYRKVRFFWTACPNTNLKCFQTTDGKLAKELSQLPTAERFGRIATLFAENFEYTGLQIQSDKAVLERGTLSEFLSSLSDSESKKFYYKSLGLTLDYLIQLKFTYHFDFRHPDGTSVFYEKSENNWTYFASILKDKMVLTEHTTAIFEDVSDIAETIKDHPIETLRWYESQSKYGLNGSLILTDIGFALQGLRRFFTDNKRTSAHISKILDRWPYEEYYEGTLGALLLQNVLTHPKYFFTVEPEKEEIPAVRPYFPLTLKDPRVRELKKTRGEQVPLEGPELQIELACEDNPVTTPTMFVNCYPGLPIPRARSGELGHGDETQSGAENGRFNQGLLQSQRSGESADSRDGVITKDSLGQERNGELPLNKHLSTQEQNIPPVLGAREVKAGDAVVKQRAMTPPSIDPREEVHLQPKTWAWLIKNAEKSSFLIESLPKVLLHHVYRKKLRPIWVTGDQLRMRILEPSDYDLSLLTLSQSDYARSLPSEDLRSLYKPNNRRFFEIDPRVIQAAVDEITTNPKNSYILLMAKGTTPMEDNQQIQNKVFGTLRGTALGFEGPLAIPFICVAKDGRKDFVLYDSSFPCIRAPGEPSHSLTKGGKVISDLEHTFMGSDLAAVKLGGFWNKPYIAIYPIGPDSQRQPSDIELKKAADYLNSRGGHD